MSRKKKEVSIFDRIRINSLSHFDAELNVRGIFVDKFLQAFIERMMISLFLKEE